MTEFLEGRVALVTGGGRGLGRGIARGLAQAGARVVVLARSGDDLAETVAGIRAAGGEAASVQADLGQLEQIADVAKQAAQPFGPIEVLVNNAAVVWPLGPSVSIDLDDWATALRINVTAVAALTFALLPSMLERGWGRIVNVSSGVAAHPEAMIGANAYTTSKAALEGHSLGLAAELAGTGVLVNVFRPGTVDTPMQTWIRGQDPAEIGAGLHERFTRMYTGGTLITPERSAQALLDELARGTSGEVWNVPA